MKKFTFYYVCPDGSCQATSLPASNQGIAISKFKAMQTGFKKIIKIVKEK